jgi:hypothetical protein
MTKLVIEDGENDRATYRIRNESNNKNDNDNNDAVAPTRKTKMKPRRKTTKTHHQLHPNNTKN